jgi:stage III sporulation protein AE
LPVVGGIISDAAGAILSGAAMLRNGIGSFGMVAVICVCLIPFLRLSVHYLMYKTAAALCGALSPNRLSGLISGIGTALGLTLALVGSGAIIMFFSIISAIKAVGYA